MEMVERLHFGELGVKAGGKEGYSCFCFRWRLSRK
jgi:hypothetical protein